MTEHLWNTSGLKPGDLVVLHRDAQPFRDMPLRVKSVTGKEIVLEQNIDAVSAPEWDENAGVPVGCMP